MSKKTCPVCSELSDQCLPCNSYVVDSERIYYNEIKNYGAIEEYELQFIEHIHKHHVVAFFHKGKLYIPSRQGRLVPLAIGLQWNVWQLKQAEINQLKTELALCREENKGLVSRVNEQHSINTALNSETIKQREQIQHYMGKCVERNKQIDEGLKLIKSLYKSEFSQRSNADIHVSQIREIEKALRGEHEN